MNERIKELVRNAGLTIEHDVVFGSHSYEGKLGMHGDEIEKFAESVIRECVSLFDGSEEMKTVGFLSHKEIVDKIEEHFRS